MIEKLVGEEEKDEEGISWIPTLFAWGLICLGELLGNSQLATAAASAVITVTSEE